MTLIKNKIFYTYEDITLLPSKISSVKHREECIPLDENGKLPLFTAPMDTVVNHDNFSKFENEGINAILPRTEPLDLRVEYSVSGKWAAYSLKEFEDVFCKEKFETNTPIKVLIDVANGHMESIFEVVKTSKSIHKDNIVLMVGNIANPNTYEAYAKLGVDYIRVGIGGGLGCLSTSNTAIHMPMASLIDETVEIRDIFYNCYDKRPKIIADGGVRNYRDIIKALALGADYVMCGGVFAKMLESAAKKPFFDDNEWCNLTDELIAKHGIHIKDNKWYNANGKRLDIVGKFYGMASKDGQIALNGKKVKTSEGLTKNLPIEYTMHGWTENFKDYLRSAMSYTNCKTLEEFKKNCKLIINSQNAVNAVNK